MQTEESAKTYLSQNFLVKRQVLRARRKYELILIIKKDLYFNFGDL